MWALFLRFAFSYTYGSSYYIYDVTIRLVCFFLPQPRSHFVFFEHQRNRSILNYT